MLVQRLAPALLVLVAGTLGCGTEAGRVPFSSDGTASASVQLKAGEVAFWTDLDIEYSGDAALAYSVELEQNGAPVATATCNPLGSMSVKLSWVETNFGDKHSRSGSGKMGCKATLPADGLTSVKATLAFATKPATLALKKADLVLKQ